MDNLGGFATDRPFNTVNDTRDAGNGRYRPDKVF